MKKILQFISDVIFLVLLIIALVLFIHIVFKSSIFNTFSKIKFLELYQLLFGFVISLTTYSMIQILSIVFYGFIKEHFPKFKVQTYKLFSLISKISVPIFFVTWMLLSLQETQFSILTNILATTALFSDLKIGKTFFNRIELFNSYYDFPNDEK